jgi:hypothetical protein
VQALPELLSTGLGALGPESCVPQWVAVPQPPRWTSLRARASVLCSHAPLAWHLHTRSQSCRLLVLTSLTKRVSPSYCLGLLQPTRRAGLLICIRMQPRPLTGMFRPSGSTEIFRAMVIRVFLNCIYHLRLLLLLTICTLRTMWKQEIRFLGRSKHARKKGAG